MDSPLGVVDKGMYDTPVTSSETLTDNLPPKPVEPLPEECCGSGCKSCVFDIYEEDLRMWKLECQKFLQGMCDDQHIQAESNSSVLNKDSFTRFKISSITSVNDDTKLFRFEIPNNAKLGIKHGQHIIARMTIPEGTITRQYTPVSPLSASSYFDVIIKIYSNGKMTPQFSTLKEGDSVEWRGPYGSLEYKPNSYHTVLMLAAGTGVAPMMQIIPVIVENEEDETFVKMFYSCRTYKDILLKDTLDQFKKYWNFSIIYILSQECDSTVGKFGDELKFSRLDEELLQSLCPKPRDKLLALVCGPRSYNQNVVHYLDKINLPKEDLYVF